MKAIFLRKAVLAGSAVLAAGLLVQANAQAPAAQPAGAPGFNPNMTGAPGGGAGRGPQGPRCAGGVEQLPDNRVTFRFCAPNAQSVSVTGDLFVPANAFTKGEAGLWTGTTPQPIGPDTYRYYYTVDGVSVVDPNAKEFSDTLSGIRGMVEVKGPAGDYQTFNKDIPHGQVHQVYYWSGAFNAQRRMQVYTPPGYEARDSRRYPVLYIRHGAGDNDSSWMTAGRANYILDNLIAAKKAVPMIIVSTADSGGIEQPKGGVTPAPAVPAPPAAGPPPGAGAAGAGGFGAAQGPSPTGTGAATPSGTYGRDLFEVVIPYIDKHYRTIANARNRAMAGLSAGGAATLNNGLPNPQVFEWIGVYSIGTNPESYLARNKVALEKGRASNKLLYYAYGREDGIVTASGPGTNKMLADLGYRNYVFNESEGGHTWINWRRYLNDFAPRLFK